MAAGFDAMAVAIDWLDAYRAAKLDTMLDLYDDDASLECGCDGETILVGKAAMKEYWLQRFAETSPLELDDIQPAGDGVALTYQTGDGLVRVVFSFNAAGKIARTQCGKSAEITPLRPASP
jgi:ketosteroid isomerase-like protein